MTMDGCYNGSVDCKVDVSSLTGARNMYIQGGYRHVAFEPIFTSLWEGRLGQRLELMCKLLRK